MVRRYSEPVEVKATDGMPSPPGSLDVADSSGTASGGRPEAFIWRGRLYVVRAILGHWRERRAWWREALDPPAGQPHGIAAAARERHVWRVEASPGRLARTGVFDLARDDLARDDLARDDPARDDPAEPALARHQATGWQLLQVVD